MKIYILTLVLICSALTGKALTKESLAEQLVYNDRAYTWFKGEYRNSMYKIYGRTLAVKRIVFDNLAKNEKQVKKSLVDFYVKHLTKGEMLALTMPLSLIRKKDLARIKQARSTSLFLEEHPEVADSIGLSLIAQLDVCIWTGTDKIASHAVNNEGRVAMQ